MNLNDNIPASATPDMITIPRVEYEAMVAGNAKLHETVKDFAAKLISLQHQIEQYTRMIFGLRPHPSFPDKKVLGNIKGRCNFTSVSCAVFNRYLHSVDHDCNISDFVHISPNATLCGGVSVGEGSLIGAVAVLIPGVSIGKWATIGAGSVIIRDIPDGATVVGNPGRIIKLNPEFG